jgi:5-methylcytosine-specific restriction endonuclease McrA
VPICAGSSLPEQTVSANIASSTRTTPFFGCEVDHIISVKHEGATTAENLAYACAFCNRNKGSDIGSVDPHSGNFVRFFNPRMDR